MPVIRAVAPGEYRESACVTGGRTAALESSAALRQRSCRAKRSRACRYACTRAGFLSQLTESAPSAGATEQVLQNRRAGRQAPVGFRSLGRRRLAPFAVTSATDRGASGSSGWTGNETLNSGQQHCRTL